MTDDSSFALKAHSATPIVQTSSAGQVFSFHFVPCIYLSSPKINIFSKVNDEN